jgi:hypothetical protein
MRFFEIAPLKRIKPMTPAQGRLYARRQQVEKARKALKHEQDLQRRRREQEQRQREQSRRRQNS